MKQYNVDLGGDLTGNDEKSGPTLIFFYCYNHYIYIIVYRENRPNRFFGGGGQTKAVHHYNIWGQTRLVHDETVNCDVRYIMCRMSRTRPSCGWEKHFSHVPLQLCTPNGKGGGGAGEGVLALIGAFPSFNQIPRQYPASDVVTFSGCPSPPSPSSPRAT